MYQIPEVSTVLGKGQLLLLAMNGSEALGTVFRYVFRSRMAADVMERQGDAELALGKPAEAIRVWADAEKMAEVAHYTERRIGVPMKTQLVYEEARRTRDAEKTAAQIQRIRWEAQHPAPPSPAGERTEQAPMAAPEPGAVDAP